LKDENITKENYTKLEEKYNEYKSIFSNLGLNDDHLKNYKNALDNNKFNNAINTIMIKAKTALNNIK